MRKIISPVFWSEKLCYNSLEKIFEWSIEVKKIFLILTALIIFSSNCFAMTFSQPVKTGFKIIRTQAGGGIIVENATQNNGDFYKRTYNGKTTVYDGKNGKALYGKGVARWGNGMDALFAHYNYYSKDSNVYFGGNDVKNTIPINSMIFGEEIYKISTNEGITFYMIHTSYDLPDETWWTLIGRRNDGVWVKYFSSLDITKKYFGQQGNVWNGLSICCDDFRVKGDTIVIEYSRYHKNSGQRGNLVKEGEFQFKWNDAAQWFGIEQIIY